eukprot:gb/GECG01005937.1/.p1 GENE.gb/GECG01005937.1/~~gb/GECG01005937.1/.p1  ORF type:complete len:344 (+),score=31.25 gb/GECG01005937.1/:1-1032(+)
MADKEQISSSVKWTEYANDQRTPEFEAFGRTIHRKINQYGIVRKIGTGATGKVFEGVDTESGQQVAVKLVDRSKLSRRWTLGAKSELDHVYRGTKIHSSFAHRNIVQLYEAIENVGEEGEKMAMIFEYMDKGPLNSTPERTVEGAVESESLCTTTRLPLDPWTARLYMRDLLEGLNKLHEQNIAHRDIKPANCLVSSEPKLAISDLGCARVYQERPPKTTESPGTVVFSSPESLQAEESHCPFLADMWAVGLVLCLMLFDSTPITENESLVTLSDYEAICLIRGLDQSRLDTWRRRQFDKLEMEDQLVKDKADDLLSKLLQVSAGKRAHCHQLLHHPLFEGIS